MESAPEERSIVFKDFFNLMALALNLGSPYIVQTLTVPSIDKNLVEL